MLWRSDVRYWLESLGRDATQLKRMSSRDEEEVCAWFSVLDMDNSGSVEEDEIQSLMHALGVTCSRSMLVELFASIGKEVSAELTLAEFLRLMIVNSVRLTGASSNTSCVADGSGLFDANARCSTRLDSVAAWDARGLEGRGREERPPQLCPLARRRLMMLAYRRTRLLEDIADPIKRRNFVSEAAFAEAYGFPAVAQAASPHGGHSSRGSPFSRRASHQSASPRYSPFARKTSHHSPATYRKRSFTGELPPLRKHQPPLSTSSKPATIPSETGQTSPPQP